MHFSFVNMVKWIYGSTFTVDKVHGMGTINDKKVNLPENTIHEPEYVH